MSVYRIHTPRLVLRCMGPEDAQRRKDAVDASGAHLSSFFGHSEDDPMSLDAHAALIRRHRSSFDADQDRGYGAFDPDSGELLGEVSLLRRAGIGALEIGYWLSRSATGRGLATEMARAVVKVGFEVDRVRRMDILCKPENEASANVARRLGFTFEGRLRDRQLAPHHDRSDLLCFTLLASEYPTTEAATLPIELFDFLGRPLSLPG